MSVKFKRKHQWTIKNSKRKGNIYRKTYIDLHNILQRSQGERDGQRKRSESEDRGSSPKEEFNRETYPGRVTLCQRRKERIKGIDNAEKVQRHEDRGSNPQFRRGDPKGRYPFPLMSKGER
jgi:hypothetical protein